LEAAPDKVHSLEHYSIFQEGREKILEVHFSTIHQEKQNKRVYLLFIRDVTQRKRMEEHIRRSDRLVSLGVLAAGIAHEMRNPLTGISLLLDDLHDRLDEMPRERELIQRSLHEMDRLENLINGLLEFAMPSRGVKLQVRPLMEVVDKTLFLVRKMCRNQKISLSIHGEEPLPLLHLDPEKLQQALLNLLLNSIQAMPDGGSLSVEVKTISSEESLTSGPAVRVLVADTGKGIAAEDIPYIFDPFFSRNPSGCGLGLAIVHSIVEEHGGHISVTSRPGEGTTFWIDLPVSEGSIAAEESLHSEPRPA
jgi:signal transduction histidine kinase